MLRNAEALHGPEAKWHPHCGIRIAPVAQSMTRYAHALLFAEMGIAGSDTASRHPTLELRTLAFVSDFNGTASARSWRENTTVLVLPSGYHIA